MATRNISIEDAGASARDVMLTEPNTFASSTSVGDARAEFESPRQKLLVVCDGDRYVGSIRRGGLDGLDESSQIGDHIDPSVPTLRPEADSSQVPELAATAGLTRIPVVDEDGRFAGLICFNPGASTFCVR